MMQSGKRGQSRAHLKHAVAHKITSVCVDKGLSKWKIKRKFQSHTYMAAVPSHPFKKHTQSYCHIKCLKVTLDT